MFLGRVVENIDGVGDDSTEMLESSDGVVDDCKETGEQLGKRVKGVQGPRVLCWYSSKELANEEFVIPEWLEAELVEQFEFCI